MDHPLSRGPKKACFAWASLAWLGLVIGLGCAGPTAVSQETPEISRFQIDDDGFGSIGYRSPRTTPVVLLGGSIPSQVTEPVATNSPTAGEGAFRVPLGGALSGFFRLRQELDSGPVDDGLPRFALGAAFTVAIRSDGSLWSWGSNFRGALGNGLGTSTNLPTPVGAPGPWKSVTCGFNHALALRGDGTLWGWGENRYGEVTGDALGQVPAPVAIVPEYHWRRIAAGTWFSLAIRDDGTLWSWGQNFDGQLGLGHQQDTDRPVQVGTDHDWVRVAAGASYALGIRQDGSLWQWGAPFWGAPSTLPVRLQAEGAWKDVAAGNMHAVGLRADGTLWAWGDNSLGQRGAGTNRPPTGRLMVQVGTDTDWQALSAAANQSLAVRADGTVWTWGEHSFGALGLGDSILRTNRPTLVTGIGPARTAVMGRDHAIALLEDGSLAGWGYNATGEVGDGTRERRFQPVAVVSEGSWAR